MHAATGTVRGRLGLHVTVDLHLFTCSSLKHVVHKHYIVRRPPVMCFHATVMLLLLPGSWHYRAHRACAVPAAADARLGAGPSSGGPGAAAHGAAAAHQQWLPGDTSGRLQRLKRIPVSWGCAALTQHTAAVFLECLRST